MTSSEFEPLHNTAFHAHHEFTESDMKWMQHAYEQAALAALDQEVPVGAVIVSEQQIIGRGRNCLIARNDPTAHAEILAIQSACQAIHNYRLPKDATLYVTLEPCTMCVGALIHARIHRVVFATPEPKAGSLVSARQLLNTGYYNHIFQFQGGCMQTECAAQLSHFFKQRREQKRLSHLSRNSK